MRSTDDPDLARLAQETLTTHGFYRGAVDGKWGAQSAAAFAAYKREAAKMAAAPPAAAAPGGRKLLGDGTWPWSAEIDGADIVVINARATCFGGANDPQDSGETASGVSTKKDAGIVACALPMDGRQFPGLSRAEHIALDGSPIPRLPWQTQVRVTRGSTTITVPIIDLGPAKRTGNAIDLTIAAARLLDPKATATNFEARVVYRILGGARYVQG